MNTERARKLCLSLPHTTENVQWGNDLVMKIAGKMFCVLVLDPGPLCASFKVTPEQFAELVERPGIVPAPYAARYHWVALESFDALPARELEAFVRQSYELVFAALPKKKRTELRPG